MKIELFNIDKKIDKERNNNSEATQDIQHKSSDANTKLKITKISSEIKSSINTDYDNLLNDANDTINKIIQRIKKI